MARLPSDMYIINQIGHDVVIWEEGPETEIVRFDVMDSDAVARAQSTIFDSKLSDEDKCFAHFWSGYFYACARS